MLEIFLNERPEMTGFDLQELQFHVGDKNGTLKSHEILLNKFNADSKWKKDNLRRSSALLVNKEPIEELQNCRNNEAVSSYF